MASAPTTNLFQDALKRLDQASTYAQISAEALDQLRHPKATLLVSTSEADAILARKGTLLLPDILANAGGVTVSYFEWVQNKAGFYWDESEVQERLKKIMTQAFDQIFALKEEKQLDMRTSAYVHALNRIANAIEAKGTVEYFANGSRNT